MAAPAAVVMLAAGPGVQMNNLKRFWQPVENIGVGEWAQRNRYIAEATSALHGKWDTGNSPWLASIMNAITDPYLERVIMMVPTQCGKTEVILNSLFYFIAHDPSSIMYLVPTKTFRDEFIRIRLNPNIKATPAIKKLIDASASTATAEKNKENIRMFPGGFFVFATSQTPSDLSSKPARILFGDEIDRCKLNHDVEGRTVDLAERRTESFYDRKIIYASTPVLERHSEINKQFELTKKMELFLSCHHCKDWQFFDDENLIYKVNKNGITHDANLVCKNGCVITNAERLKMIQKPKWQCVGNKEIIGAIGFHTTALSIPMRSLESLAEEKHKSKSSEDARQIYFNSRLAKTFSPTYEINIKHSMLQKFSRHFSDKIHPNAAGFDDVKRLIITGGADVQGDRIELTLIGTDPIRCNQRNQIFVLGHYIFKGDFHTASRALLLFIRRKILNFDILLVAVDAGYLTERVCELPKINPRILPVVGRTAYQHAKPVIIGETQMGKKMADGKRKFSVVQVNVNRIKNQIAEFNQEAKTAGKTVSLHYSESLESEYYQQLTAENIVAKNYSGQTVYVWENPKKLRNECLDTTVYALAAFNYAMWGA